MWKTSIRTALPLALALAVAGCDALPGQQPSNDKSVPSESFPNAKRPVSSLGASRWASEVERDRVKEADQAMDLAGVAEGMTVADIGAGEGYYTIRLASRVGEKGRVLAQDVVPQVRDALADRVYREKLDNVSVTLGGFADPKLPANSFDRIFLMHMYHEVAAPYEFLWRLRPALREGGRVVVVEIDRPTGDHGMPPATLRCEMAAVGFRAVADHPMPQKGVYLAMFERVGKRPQPEQIKPCG
jgi:ubiquinone/menaquinone biosynthesis C-methylase UbiE